MEFLIKAYDDRFRDQIIGLSLRSWEPVFQKLEPAVPAYVYREFYPQGWQARQTQDISRILDTESERVWVAVHGDIVLGWVGVRLHDEDHMGEIYIIAVDPDHHREGIASALIAAATDYMRAAGMRIVMVETGDDPGHVASRIAYERNGFERWPVARYFREI